VYTSLNRVLASCFVGIFVRSDFHSGHLRYFVIWPSTTPSQHTDHNTTNKMSFPILLASIILGSLAALTCLCLLAERIALSIRASSSSSTSYTHHDAYSDCEKGGFVEKEVTFTQSLAKNATVVERAYEADKLEMVGVAPDALTYAVDEEVLATEEEEVVVESEGVYVASYATLPHIKSASVSREASEMFVDEGSMQVKGVRDVRGDRDVAVGGVGVGVGGPVFGILP
jgi:hypothetical protein